MFVGEMGPRFLLIASLICAGATLILADDAEDRGKLAGKWQPAAGEKSDYGNWLLEAKEGGVRVIQEANGQKVAEYECNTMGRECEMREDGHNAKVSMWFNGSRLVQIRTRGSEVVKRRFHVTGNGNTLELEVIPIAPGGKTEVVRMSRCQTPSQ